MKISLVITLKNEEKGVTLLFKSIVNQTRIPDEIVVVDSNSTDGTVSIITAILSKSNIPYKIIVKDANIAKGRNLAIENSKYSLIAVTDGGCKLEKRWLSNLEMQMRNNKNKVDVVYGFSKALGQTLISKCYATYYNIQINKNNVGISEYSSRSVLFTKRAWKLLGGYPEWMTLAGEDSYFFMKLNGNFKTVFTRKAICYWYHGYNTLSKLFQVHKRNSFGDGETSLRSGRYVLLFIIYIFIISGSIISINKPVLVIPTFIILFIFLFRKSFSVYSKNKKILSFLIVPLINIFRDFGMITGYLDGALNRFRTV